MERIVLHSVPGGSSGTGASYYLSGAACPRKAQLDLEQKEMGVVQTGGRAAQIGTMFHALMDVYYSKGTSDVVLELDDLELNENAGEAMRLFAEYTKRFPSSGFGEVIGSELQVPRDENEATRVREFLGVPFTLRLDLITELKGPEIPSLVQRRPELEGIEPGVYIIDHKTSGARGKDDPIKYRISTQFIAYQMVWNHLNPDRPCKGMIANCVVRHKKLVDNSFYSVIVPPPTFDQQIGLKNFLGHTAVLMKTGVANWAACYQWGVCHHYTSGRCDRR